LTGVKPDTFEAMLRECEIADKIRKIEDVLIKSGKFSLPSKKALYEDGGLELEYIIVDATSSSNYSTVSVATPKKRGSKEDSEKDLRLNPPPLRI
jgi:hypothetical protein